MRVARDEPAHCSRCTTIDEMLQLLPRECDFHKNCFLDSDATHTVNKTPNED